MKELGIVLDFQSKQMTIDNIIWPMTNINRLAKSNLSKAWAINNSTTNKPTTTVKVTDQVVHILDAKNEKADLQAVDSSNCTRLSPDQQKKLLDVLTEFEEIFNGTLGDWKTKPNSFELKEGAKPYHGRPYPFPHTKKQ